MPDTHVDVAKSAVKDDTILYTQKTGSTTCCTCGYCNKEGLHWCVECGTAIIETSCASSPGSVIDVDVDKVTSRVMRTATTVSHTEFSAPIPPRQCTADLVTLNRSYHASNFTKNPIRKKSPSKPSLGGYILTNSGVRYWDTSGVYMWRKPSSLKLMNVPHNAQIVEHRGHSKPAFDTPDMKKTRVRNS